MQQEFPRCPYCSNQTGLCDHLLLTVDQDSKSVSGGILSGDALVLQDAFQAIYKEVARREAACGRGLLLEATKAFFWNYGYDARSGELYAELDRDFATEYLLDILDCAPNIVRAIAGSAPDTIEFIWSDVPGAARKLLADNVEELRRLADLPICAAEWIPVNVD